MIWPDKKEIIGRLDLAIECIEKGFHGEALLHANMARVALSSHYPFSQFCYPDCKYLSVTEKDQTGNGKTEPHVCKKYYKRVYHGEDHPYLNKLPECDYKG